MQTDPVFLVLAVVTLAAATAAMSLRNLVHCALCLAVTFGAIGALYVRLGAEFLGLAQVLVYVGAVGILVVFAILLTRGGQGGEVRPAGGAPWMGLLVAVLVGGALLAVVTQAPSRVPDAGVAPGVTVRELGTELMTRYVLPVEAIGLLLTAAMIGAVVVAMRDRHGQGN